MDVFNAVKKLEMLFSKKGFSLYFVGGTVRDYLLKKGICDVDLVTDATPKEMKDFLDNGDFTYEKYGFVKVKFDGYSFDLTTLRIEDEYTDCRHPGKIKFTKKLEEDCLRRDFTINGLYMDTAFNIYDYVGGVSDLNYKLIKMIGNPVKRLSEDPLRIIRAIRFSLTYKLKLDDSLKKAIFKCKDSLGSINPDKIRQDILKIKNSSREEIYKTFSDFGIQKYLDVLK